MKPSDKIIIYDDSCPMCSVYTKAFIHTGFLTAENRKSFSSINAELLEKIDRHKCKNEIPLINASANTVKYGIDALLDILGDKLPVIKTICNSKPVNWVLKKLYNLISFNRRVVTATANAKGNFDCTPDFNVKYRLLFLGLGLLFNTLMLIPEYWYILINSALHTRTLAELQVAHFIFVLINISIALTLEKQPALEFLGQANMLALLTTLLMFPLLILNYNLFLPAVINNIYLFLLLIFIINEYKRRMRYAKILPGKKVLLLNIISVLSFMLYLSWQ